MSIAQWFDDKEAHKCGYCKSESWGSIAYGMWTQSLSLSDYQTLIDRGWRRSGKYCYKPVLNETCCPLYTIRCEALKLSLTKSQKKVIKRMNKFLIDGDIKTKKILESGSQNEQEQIVYRDPPQNVVDLTKLRKSAMQKDAITKSSGDYVEGLDALKELSETRVSNANVSSTSKDFDAEFKKETLTDKMIRKGKGPDPNKPPCKKSKIIRMEKKQKKLEAGDHATSITKDVPENSAKSLEDLLSRDISANNKHFLKINFVTTSKPNSDWNKYCNVEFELYQKYQTIVHGDPPEKTKMDGFLRFLVDTPLPFQPFERKSDSSPLGFGSFHQQYWLDDKLIAVGVIDILPRSVSAKYFFYDPDYRELTLGTYGSLRELELTRSLHSIKPSIEHYYMGYYLHSCEKMRYKGKFSPSYLLCPETYEWFPIEKCLPKLEITKYCRFNEALDAADKNASDESTIDNIMIFFNEKLITFKIFKRAFGKEDVYRNVGKLVGNKCARNIIFCEC